MTNLAFSTKPVLLINQGSSNREQGTEKRMHFTTNTGMHFKFRKSDTEFLHRASTTGAGRRIATGGHVKSKTNVKADIAAYLLSSNNIFRFHRHFRSGNSLHCAWLTRLSASKANVAITIQQAYNSPEISSFSQSQDSTNS